MSLPVVFRREASADVEEICRFLNNEHARLGDKFIGQLNEKLQKAASHPRVSLRSFGKMSALPC